MCEAKVYKAKKQGALCFPLDLEAVNNPSSANRVPDYNVRASLKLTHSVCFSKSIVSYSYPSLLTITKQNVIAKTFLATDDFVIVLVLYLHPMKIYIHRCVKTIYSWIFVPQSLPRIELNSSQLFQILFLFQLLPNRSRVVLE